MASIRDYMSAGASKLIGFVQMIFSLPIKAGRRAWFAIRQISETLWWWGLLSVRLFGRHYVWLFLLLFFVWMWWQGLSLLITMSELITSYSANLIKSRDTGQNYEGIRNLLLGLAALLSVPFFFLRTWINERQTRTQEQGHMTDRIAKAVEALGTEKQVKTHFQKPTEVSAPNLEVRIGAIYALERISQDSARDHWQVMEILTAYLRENSKKRPQGIAQQSGKDAVFYEWLRKQGPPRIDFQAITTVLARRSATRRLEERQRCLHLDLRGIFLISPDFYVSNTKPDLSEANFGRSTLISAELGGACLNLAFMRGADLRRANLREAELNGADLSDADLSGADLRGAHFRGANLRGAKLSGANLCEADFSGACLVGTNLSGADLRMTDLRSAKLIEEDVEGAQYIGVSASVLGLDQAVHLSLVHLPKGWYIVWDEQSQEFDITTPDGPYLDLLDRKSPS